ncbi:unnamed protein product [Phytophthora fragariaefolia]|uniref:Unnamed protein product n=1 Tax=Phytophthora fragariaefolia TaxID=1490495 RepID=A0A9W6Y1S2_9STRA|nr:unnamed protein product [Phytophthora fragariaefolia]
MDVREVNWKSLWRELKKAGWSARPPRGLEVDYRYVPPGGNATGADGTDYFLDTAGVIQHYLDSRQTEAEDADDGAEDASVDEEEAPGERSDHAGDGKEGPGEEKDEQSDRAEQSCTHATTSSRVRPGSALPELVIEEDDEVADTPIEDAVADPNTLASGDNPEDFDALDSGDEPERDDFDKDQRVCGPQDVPHLLCGVGVLPQVRRPHFLDLQVLMLSMLTSDVCFYCLLWCIVQVRDLCGDEAEPE